jgi:hypothetical protein
MIGGAEVRDEWRVRQLDNGPVTMRRIVAPAEGPVVEQWNRESHESRRRPVRRLRRVDPDGGAQQFTKSRMFDER